MKLLSTAAAVMAFDTTSAFRTFSPSHFSRIRTWPHAVSSPLKWVNTPRRRSATTPVSCAQTSSDVAATSETKTEESNSSRHTRRKGKSTQKSFVQWDMRRAAMKLHTRDQAPKEGKQKEKGMKFSEWKPSRRGYLQFLVDERLVYNTLEETCASNPGLSEFRNTGLERTEALGKDIAWMVETYPDARVQEEETSGTKQGVPPPTEAADEYSTFLRDVSERSIPAFMCHFYNQYFAHTAGGLMIGRKVSDMCLDGKTLEFYKWGDEDVKELLEGVRKKIDAKAKGWTDEEKEECIGETARTFEYGGRLMSSITSS